MRHISTAEDVNRQSLYQLWTRWYRHPPLYKAGLDLSILNWGVYCDRHVAILIYHILFITRTACASSSSKICCAPGVWLNIRYPFHEYKPISQKYRVSDQSILTLSEAMLLPVVVLDLSFGMSLCHDVNSRESSEKCFMIPWFKYGWWQWHAHVLLLEYGLFNIWGSLDIHAIVIMGIANTRVTEHHVQPKHIQPIYHMIRCFIAQDLFNVDCVSTDLNITHRMVGVKGMIPKCYLNCRVSSNCTTCLAAALLEDVSRHHVETAVCHENNATDQVIFRECNEQV